MHMADALVRPVMAGVMDVAAAGAAGYSLKKIKNDVEDTKKIPVMGVMGAFVFATQMINFTIPGTGSSGHICGAMLLAALLGPYAGFLTMIGILVVQCLLFADGGILALGCNIWNMAFYGCFVGGACIMGAICREKISKKRIMAASVLGCVLSLQFGAFSVVLQTLLSGITELPFGVFAGLMQPIHLAIGLVEGVITGSVLSFVWEARPELLWVYSAKQEGVKDGRMGKGQTIGIFLITALVLGGGLSLLASENPDGLEWSMAKVAGEVVGTGKNAVNKALEGIQNRLSVMADYTFGGSDHTWALVAAGLAGTLVTLAVCALIGKCLCQRSRHECKCEK